MFFCQIDKASFMLVSTASPAWPGTARAFSLANLQAAIELTGLPTLQDVEDDKNDLQTGRRSLTGLGKFSI